MASPCTPKDCEKLYTSADKWQVSLLSGLLFLLVASPFLYGLVDKLVRPLTGLAVADNGCPTLLGLVLHAVVFVLIVRALMQ